MNWCICIILLVTLVRSARGNAGLSVTSIRLADGSGPYEGRVEVNVNGVWGTICDNNFDYRDANVLCRMMNLSMTAFFHNARHGQGSGPIFAQNLGCQGHETHIQQCSFQPATSCYHQEDVSLICSDCGALRILDGEIDSISSDGTTLYTTCNSGNNSNYTTATCNGTGKWTSSCTPLDIGDMRLVDGLGLYDGRVEVMVNGTWGDICTNSFSTSDATAICNIMFGLPRYTHYAYDIYGYGSNSKVHIDQLDCNGNEDDINDCYYELAGSCDLRYRAVVICDAYPLNITDIHLVDGSSQYDGRVEVKHGDEWGTICSYSFYTYEGHALCRMMNLSLTTYYTYTNGKFGPGSGPILIEQFYCTSDNVYHINDCNRYYPPRKRYCSHNRDVALVCTECGQPSIPNGEITSSNGTIMTVTCDTGYGPTTYTIECLSNGTWLQDETCEAIDSPFPTDLNCTADDKQSQSSMFVDSYPLNITDMRLVDGVGLYDGRLEVQVNGTTWGTVCSSSFSFAELRAVCNIMFGSTSYRGYTYSYYGSGTGQIFIDQLDCTGTETHINECKYNVINTCSHSRDIAVACNAAPLNVSEIRLIGQNASHIGRVEVLVDGEWGTVCNYGINLNVANTLCNMMNLSLWTYHTTPVYGMGSGPMHIGRLSCNGNYTHINQCTYYSPYGRYCTHSKDLSLACTGSSEYCTHSKDLSLACTDNPLDVTDLRLVPGPYHGRVEINVNGEWGTVCDNNFATSAGEVICRTMNGLALRSWYGSAYYGQGKGSVHVDKLLCSGNEPDINKCALYYDNSCKHNEDVSVLCYGPDLNITGVTLADGTGPYDGRIEIEVNGTMGTICDSNFDIYDADAFCRMLGLRAAQYFTGARYGQGTGPVYIDDLYCNYGTNDLNNCRYTYTNSCNHERDVSVVCNECGQPEIYYWDIGYFSFSGSTLFADCAYYRTYIGTLRMTCDNSTNTWTTEGECQEYSYPLDISGLRLVDGVRSSDGRVEVESMDTWGTICDDGFGMNEAHTICQMLGFWPAVTYYNSSRYGRGTGPIFVDDLQCGTSASHINNCTYVTYDDCSHDNDIAVVCLDCGDPKPVNGTINGTATNYGSVIEVSCDEGYRLEGNSTISCEMNGRWSDLSYCQLIDCGNAEPSHGTVNSTSTTNGTVVSVSCNPGYNLSGEAIVTCQENDTWTDYPTCEILDCGLPNPEHADVELPSDVTTYKSIAVITCKQGYLPDGSATVACLETGKWEEMPVCKIVDCGDPVPNKGSGNDTITTYGTVVEITCDDGHDITGNSTIVCHEDGTWSDNPVCDTNDCGRPSISNGQVDDSNGTTSGSIVALTCNPGYDIIGSPVIKCLGSGWNDTSTECVLQDCGDPTPKNGDIVTSSGTQYGDTATIECNEGHKMEGDSTITCEDGGEWSSDPVCVIRDCGPVDSPVNGNIDDVTGTVFNSTVEISCDTDFLLVGALMLRCRNDGTWSDNAPTCVELREIGDACEADVNCKAGGSVCKKAVCTCQTGVYDSRADKCDTMPLYPYGLSEGDTILTEKKCSDQMTFSPGLPLLGRIHTKIYVCRHGYVSFTKKYRNPTPPNNVEEVTNGFTKDLVAPFLATSSSNNVYYRSYDVLDSYESLIERAEVRDIKTRVKQFAAVGSFKARFVLIVTWDNVLPASANLNIVKSEASTFQLVLASDGEMTYSFYIYPSGLMKWMSKRNTNVPVWIGSGYYVKKYEKFIHSTHLRSFTPSALVSDTIAEHGGVSGLVFNSLVDVAATQENNNVGCIAWYQENKYEKQHIDRMNSWLPQCPCSIWLARWDPWFWHIDRWNWYNKKNFTCVDMFPGRIFRPYGKSCCYDYRTSAWVDERPIAGGFFRYHPENTVDHYTHDVVPKEMCCSPLTPYCKYYYDLRPTGTCYRQSPYNFGSFWGDPHFQTLDGQNFTFNGLGEYTLLQIQTENNTFDLQARTERATKDDGNFSDATVFCAFAAKDESNASIHVELNRAKQGFSIYGNEIDLTTQYVQKTDDDTPLLDVPGGTLFVSKRGETLVVLFPSSGISLNISVTVEMLSLSTIVPKTFHNITRGLLGNYNGKPEDDFTLPNGTILRANISEREIFSYGQTWAINGDDAAFKYPDGKNHSDYHNASYVPRFLDEADNDSRLEAETFCNGPENIECVFDYVFTERKDMAEATNTLKGNTDKTRKDMSEVVPSLTGCGSVNVTVNHTVYCPVTIEDGGSVQFLSNNVNATFDEETQSIYYFQENSEPVDIRVVAMNSNGLTSSTFIVPILLCTGCNGRGSCTDVPRDDVRNTEYFKYATCECQPEYEGPDCEDVFDGCAEDPCSLGRYCTPYNATEQRLNNRAYLCDVCPNGFVANDIDHDSCSDIDECENNPCSHVCINTEGSYECTCNKSYRTDINDKHKCTDINECEDLNTPHDCLQNCSNTDGSYSCSCFNGYTLMSGVCTQDSIPETLCSNITCSSTNGGCRLNEDDNPICYCNTGYELDDNNVCIDIDECSRNVCPQNCNNTVGGFQCSCFTGYEIDGLTTCIECEIGWWGENCQNACLCTGEGVESCDPVKGCLCEEGWQGDTCDVDINECETVSDVCDDPWKTCENTPGSFHCKCIEGLEETVDGNCEDIDECSIPTLNTCSQICVNNIGSYSCECKGGFKSNGSDCENINECDVKTHDCEQMCDDKPGSYNCFCYFGYTLNDDRTTCTKLSDPCMSVYGLNCSHYCYIGSTNSECRCKDGFSLGSDDQTCIDIDECTDGRHVCDANAECKNTDGSYICECPVGSKLENDGRTCTDCDSFHYGLDCAFNCTCLHGYCDMTTGCQCEDGWHGNSCDIDLDECAVGMLECLKPNEVCVNTPGSAICTCLSGYGSNKNGTCEDVDECSDGSLNTCDQSCVNLPGGYSCECQRGFLQTDGKCKDINECENQKSDCEQFCENTLGSYRCYCEDGFKLNLTDRVSCRPESECLTSPCGDHATCFNNNGEESCRCENGFHDVSGICKDVDECQQSTKPCSDLCNNTQGSYNCSCHDGYYLAKDHQTCKVCEAGTFGEGCMQDCSCHANNSESCNPITGVCECKTGWDGADCGSDVFECNNQTICPEHSTCSNTKGGYDCICDVGFFKTSFGLCSVCDNAHYGENCVKRCTCITSNTDTCNNIDGSCECIKGWTGTNCSADVDECDKDPAPCELKQNSECMNTQGSYKCSCIEGYREVGDLCVDVDECITGIHDCIQECVNTLGSYMCKCAKGNQGYWNNCKECSGHTYGDNCTETCACKHTNTDPVERDTQVCDRVTGVCDCLVNWKGAVCEEDVDECEDTNICNGKPNSGCVNTVGWYECQCHRGYIELDNTCVLDSTPTTTKLPGTALRINHVLTISIVLPVTVDFKVPDTYEQYETLAKNGLVQYYKQFTSAQIDIEINGLSNTGYLDVDYTVVYAYKDPVVASALVVAANALMGGSKLAFDGEQYTAAITSESFDLSDDPCNILHDLEACSLDNCVVEDDIAHCKTDSSKLDLAQLIGISVGCGVFFLIVAVSVIMCMRRQNFHKKKMQRHRTDRRPLPGIPKMKQVDDVHKSQDNQGWRSNMRYLNWRTVMTRNKSEKNGGNTYDAPYAIPRAHTRQPTKLKTNDYNYMLE